MRIKNLKAQNFYDIKGVNARFSAEEKIILVNEPYDEITDKLAFCDTFLDLTNFLFFNDSYSYAKNCVGKNTTLECTVEKDGAEFTFGVKGDYKRTKKGGKVCLKKVLDWYCFAPEKELQGENGGWLEAQLCCDYQENFYPKALANFSCFNKDTYAYSPADFVNMEEFSWLKLMAKYNKIQVDLEKKLQELINNFDEIKIDERFSVGLNEEKEYVLLFGGETVLEEDEKQEALVSFCGWINNLNIWKTLCEFVGEDGNYPIFIDGVFDEILAEYKDVLLEKLRETDRQVFIISHKCDNAIEKYCDKVIKGLSLMLSKYSPKR